MISPNLKTILWPLALLAGAVAVAATSNDKVTTTKQANGDMRLDVTAPANSYRRVEVATDLGNWQGLATAQTPATGNLTVTDSQSPYQTRRFYRVAELTGTNIFTGDHIPAQTGGDIQIHPVNHASFVMRWNGFTIYADPVGAASLYSAFPRADLILVTHSHSDHYSATTLDALRNGTVTKIMAPQAVYNASSFTATLKGLTTIFKTGQTPATNNTTIQTPLTGVTVEGVPAYNTNHALGTGNAYVLTIGGKRLFISGDTGNTPEMRALTNIDVAFVCINIPFTMTVAEAANAITSFKPRVVYPYHFRNSDNTYSNLDTLRTQVGTADRVEVRSRGWY